MDYVRTTVLCLLSVTTATAQLYPAGWVRLTDDRTSDRHPAWSPDQSSIAFVRNKDEGSGMHVVIIDPDGSNRRMFTDGTDFLFYPTWFPDSQRLVVDVQEKGLYTLDITTGDWELLFVPVGHSSSTPSLSPDGRRISYAAFPPEFSSSELYVSDLDGGNVVRLTDHEYQDNRPSWSPDGSTIAFERQSYQGVSTGVYTVNIDGTGLRLVSPDSMTAHEPSWSPDGSQIAFVAGRDDDLWLVNVDGTGLRRLTTKWGATGSGYAWTGRPTWSPDGRFIVFTGYGHGNTDLFSIDLVAVISAVAPEAWGRIKSRARPHIR